MSFPAVAEALFDLRCGSDGRPQDEQDFAAFELDGLDVDENLALPDAKSAPYPAPQQGNVPAPHPLCGTPAQRKSEAHSCRVERIRARYRQKAKVRSTRLMHMRCQSSNGTCTGVMYMHCSPL